MLIAKNITKKFSGVTALNNVCLELHPGKVNAIIGENGAGKSTLMKVLSGVHTQYEGDIIYNDKKVQFTSTKDADVHRCLPQHVQTIFRRKKPIAEHT